MSIEGNEKDIISMGVTQQKTETEEQIYLSLYYMVTGMLRDVLNDNYKNKKEGDCDDAS